MSLLKLSGPAVEPLTVAEVRAHLRLTTGDQEPPATAPTVALAAPAVPGNVAAGVYRYLVTFVTATGETEAGASSAAVTVADPAVNGKVAVSAIPLGSAAVTARKLYRTQSGGSTYLLLATIADNTTTTYTDNVADAALGAGAPASNTTGDPILLRLIGAARSQAEQLTRRALITQQWQLSLDRFPWPGGTDYGGWPQVGLSFGGGNLGRMSARLASWYSIELPKPPLISVDLVQYLDVQGATQTLTANTDYVLDLGREPARLAPAYGRYWPTTLQQINAVTIRFTCGYGAAAAVPDGIKQWMLLRIGTMYENRAELEYVTRGSQLELPTSWCDGLLDDYRVTYTTDHARW